MSSFFLPARGSAAAARDKKSKKQHKIKKKRELKASTDSTKRKRKAVTLDEEIASDSDLEDEQRKSKGKSVILTSGSEDEVETAPEKRLRLAKDYLTQLEEEERAKKDLDEFEHDAIAHRLRDDVLEQAGRLQRKVADKYSPPAAGDIRMLKGHQLPVTCVVMTPDDRYVYSGSKDCCIIKWSITSGVKEVIFSGSRKGVEGTIGHKGHVLALAVSSDGKFLASGGQDKIVHIWDVVTNIHLHSFNGHRDTVSGLVFQKGNHELFSCSFDRTVKVWNLDEMAYVETLFGHQDSVSSIDCLLRERPITAGMNDRTLRVWKVAEESQLVFHGHKSCIDTVKMINDEFFVSGSQDGVALWNVMKKKPMVSHPHCLQQRGSSQGEHWVTAVTAYPNTDLVASGSCDGRVCLWRCGDNLRSLELCFTIPVNGFINSLMFSHNGEYLVAAVGQEHRLGRWWKDRTVKNSVCVISLTHTSLSTA